ncbi:MAG: hydroxymethylpyrimidine/phosphomethylpyrimidine kinase [Actinomycetota bacterium]|nr:hydroxymethylpyrimidine/phosphomethylpyrimidine kinase [Actinomycetota bacterium]
MNELPIALTVAGSDSGGGAGIQADLKVFFALGCHGTSALTALTAQNTMGVTGIHEVPPEFVTLQIDAIADDMGIDAAKTGMLSSAPIIETVAAAFAKLEVPLVVDPVFVSKHGDKLLADDAVDALRERLFPLASVVTPNLHEASALVGFDIENTADMKRAAQALVAMGAETALVKGGHLPGDRAVDVYYDGSTYEELEGPRYDTEDTHGTGCALSAAIAAGLAKGDDRLGSIRAAKDFVSGAIRESLRIGRGYGPVNIGWRFGR